MMIALLFCLFSGSFAIVYDNLKVVDSATNFLFSWTADTTNQMLHIKLSVESSGWVGFGISPNGGMVGADVFIAYIDQGNVVLNDRLALATELPPRDVDNGGTEDWIVVGGTQVGAVMTIEAKRSFTTLDAAHDHPFASGAQRLVFAFCRTNPAASTIDYHNGRFPIQLTLWGNAPPPEVDNSTFPPDTIMSVIRMPNFAVPTTQTNYFCAGFSLTSPAGKAHAIAFEPIIDKKTVVHHLLIYTCSSPVPTTPYECSSMSSQCDNILYAWAIGGPAFNVPVEAGFPFGETAAQSISLQIHYDNSAHAGGLVDTSGVAVYHTNTLRANDAAFLKVGHPTASIRLPPGADAYTIGGTCSSEDTSRIPIPEVTAFASGIHMHIRGRKLWTDLKRNGDFVTKVGEDLFYDFNFQQMKLLTPFVIIKKGDELVTTCVYNTSQETAVVVGGEATTEEMCYNFIAYYPKFSQVDGCFSTTFDLGDLSAGAALRPAMVLAGLIGLTLVKMLV